MKTTKQRVQTGLIGVTLSMTIGVGILSYNLVEMNKEINSLEKNTVALERSLVEYTDMVNERDSIIAQYKVEVEKLEENVNTLNKSNSVLQSKVEEYKKKEETRKPPSRGEVTGNEEIYKATFYTSKCKGCSGFTRTEYDVRSTIYYQGYRVVAVDPNKIPLYSILRVSYGDTSFEAIALDTGDDIQGYRLDILVRTKREAYELGRKNVSVKILRKGK